MQRDLTIRGMTCLDCSRHVTRALERVEGVTSATVDYRAGRATLELAHAVPTEALIAAAERAGYGAEPASGDGVGTAPPAGEPSPWRGTGTAREPMHGTSNRAGGAAEFDVLVIGTGGAGVAAAIQAAGMGGKVAIVEGDTLGGTCVNVGCIPSKNLIEAAVHYHAARTVFPGIATCAPAFEWRDVLAQKRALVEELRRVKYADVLASYPGVARLDGRARLLGQGRVRVGDTEHTARKIVIATGTTPSAPPIPGLDQVDALTSTTAMELEALPASMLVLGGSAVGLELGQTFARFGTRVTVIELMPRILPTEDEDISQALETHLVQEELEVHTGMQATQVERDGNEVVVHVSQGSLSGQLRAQSLLVATGRRPNARDMGLEEAGVTFTDAGFVRVDRTMRTSNPDIYAAGDVTGGPGFVYVAAAAGRVAAENAMKSLAPTGTSSDEPRELDLRTVPSVTFTSPQVGSVGLTEAAARAAGYDVEVSLLEMKDVPRALVSHDTRGFVKVVAEVASGKLLGVHALARNAGELMGEATLAIRFGLTARDVTGTLHPYLTWGESLKLAVQGLTMDVSKLSCCA